jgi:drug/metabolite transporter (DMT)-like permease
LTTERLRLIGILVLLGVGWGATQPLSKIVVEGGTGHYALIFWQACISALFLGGVLVLRRRPVPLTADILKFALVVAGLGTVVPGYTFYRSIAHLPSGVMSLIIAAVPMLALPMAVVLGRDRLTPARLAGLVLGLCGVALIALPDSGLPDRAMVAWLPLAMVGPLCYALEANYVALHNDLKADAMQAMFLASLLAALLALPLVLWSGQWVDPVATWNWRYGVFILTSALNAVLYVAYVWLAGRAGAVFASQSSYVITGAGLVWAIVLLGERFSLWIYLALALLMCGLFLVSPRRQPGRSR